MNLSIETTLKGRQDIVSVVNITRKMHTDTVALIQTSGYDYLVEDLTFKQKDTFRKID